MVVGAHDKVGCWSPRGAIVLSTDAISFPIWRTGEVTFDEPLTLEYKFIIRKGNGDVIWEELSSNRTAKLSANTVNVVENVWGTLATSSITCFPLRLGAADGELDSLPAANTSFYPVDSRGATITEKQAYPVCMEGRPIASAPCIEHREEKAPEESSSSKTEDQPYNAALSESIAADTSSKSALVAVSTSVDSEEAITTGGNSSRAAPLKRSAFILANTGSIRKHYQIEDTIGRVCVESGHGFLSVTIYV